MSEFIKGARSRRIEALAGRALQHERATHETPPFAVHAHPGAVPRNRRQTATAAVSVTPKIDVVWPVRAGKPHNTPYAIEIAAVRVGSHVVPA